MLDVGESAVLGVSIGYFFFTSWARWQYIALPLRAQLLADVADVSALALRRCSGAPIDVQQSSAKAIDDLLKFIPRSSADAVTLEAKLRSRTFGDSIRWSGSLELESIKRLAATQIYVPNLLTDDEVMARLVVARQWLTEYSTGTERVALGKSIDKVLVPTPKWSASLMALLLAPDARPATSQSRSNSCEQNRALLGQALALTYEGDGMDVEIMWHRKTQLVFIFGLVAVVLLEFFNNAGIVMLFGAFGGLLQRLWQLVYERDKKSDDPLFWSTLFLAPIAGALAAVGGLYLISFLNATNVLGSSVSSHIGWNQAFAPQTQVASLGVAFLLGFSARLLGNLVARSTAASPSTVAP